VVDAFGNPIVAVEFQARDTIRDRPLLATLKRTALRRAGVAYLEILADHSDDDIRSLLSVALRPGPGQPPISDTGD